MIARTCSNAAMKLSASGNRADGSFSRARATTASSSGETAGLNALGGSGSSVTCLSAMVTAFGPSKGTRPVSSS